MPKNVWNPESKEGNLFLITETVARSSKYNVPCLYFYNLDYMYELEFSYDYEVLNIDCFFCLNCDYRAEIVSSYWTTEKKMELTEKLKAYKVDDWEDFDLEGVIYTVFEYMDEFSRYAQEAEAENEDFVRRLKEILEA